MKVVQLTPGANLVVSVSPKQDFVRFTFTPVQNELEGEGIEEGEAENPLETILFFGIPLNEYCTLNYTPLSIMSGTYEPRECKKKLLPVEKNIVGGGGGKGGAGPNDPSSGASTKQMNEGDEKLWREAKRNNFLTYTSTSPHSITFNCDLLGPFLDISLYNSGAMTMSVEFNHIGLEKYSLSSKSIHSEIPRLRQHISQTLSHLKRLRSEHSEYMQVRSDGPEDSHHHVQGLSDNEDTPPATNSTRRQPPKNPSNGTNRTSTFSNTEFSTTGSTLTHRCDHSSIQYTVNTNVNSLPDTFRLTDVQSGRLEGPGAYSGPRHCILVIGDECSGKSSFCRAWLGHHAREEWAICDLDPRTNVATMFPGAIGIGIQTGEPGTWGTFHDQNVWFYGNTNLQNNLPEYGAILEVIGERLRQMNKNTIIKFPSLRGRNRNHFVSLLLEHMHVNAIINLGEHEELDTRLAKEHPHVVYHRLEIQRAECLEKPKKKRSNFKTKCFYEYFCGRCDEYQAHVLRVEKRQLSVHRFTSAPLTSNVNHPMRVRLQQAIACQSVPTSRELTNMVLAVSSAKRGEEALLSTVKGFILVRQVEQRHAEIQAPTPTWPHPQQQVAVLGYISYLPHELHLR